MLAKKNPRNLELVEHVTAPSGSYVETEHFPNINLGIIVVLGLILSPQMSQRIRDRHGQLPMRTIHPTPLRMAGQ